MKLNLYLSRCWRSRQIDIHIHSTGSFSYTCCSASLIFVSPEIRSKDLRIVLGSSNALTMALATSALGIFPISKSAAATTFPVPGSFNNQPGRIIV